MWTTPACDLRGWVNRAMSCNEGLPLPDDEVTVPKCEAKDDGRGSRLPCDSGSAQAGDDGRETVDREVDMRISRPAPETKSDDGST